MELMNLLPGVKVARMDLDTTAGREGHLAVLERFSTGERDVLLGTQMVAKGHHYPNVTLIGVLSADRGLCFPDFRAAERTFRLLFQAAGRTGRGEKGGKVLIQTFAPEHPMYRYIASHDYEGFAAEELAARAALGYPPAGRLMLFTISARSSEKAAAGAAAVAEAIGRSLAATEAVVLGPTPALVERVRGRHRLHLLVRGALEPEIRGAMARAARESLAGEKQIDRQWDVDPIALS